MDEQACLPLVMVTRNGTNLYGKGLAWFGLRVKLAVNLHSSGVVTAGSVGVVSRSIPGRAGHPD